MTVLLEVRQISKRFGGLQALNRVDLSLEAGQVHALIGPNGAGKTTLTNVISGLSPATEGEVRFKGQAITRRPADAICALGISRTFQNIRCFPTMTALENVMVGRHLRNRTSFWSTFFRMPLSEAREERSCRLRSEALLELVGLSQRSLSLASALSLMEQRRLEIARALASEPSLLILDEPTAGMGEAESRAVQSLILRISQEGAGILVIAHDMHLVMNVAHRVTVLNFGQKIAEGPPSEVRNDPKVEEAYLGSEQ